MKHILTTLFISLCAIFAGCSHNDADNLAGGTGGGIQPNEHAISFRVIVPQEGLIFEFAYASKSVITVDWGDGEIELLPPTKDMVAEHKYPINKEFVVKVSTSGLIDFELGYDYHVGDGSGYPNKDNYHPFIISNLRFGISNDLEDVRLFNISNSTIYLPQTVRYVYIAYCANLKQVKVGDLEICNGECHFVKWQYSGWSISNNKEEKL